MKVLYNRRVLLFCGSDIKSFFHRIFSQSFLDQFSLRYSLFLTPNGRYLNDFFVFSYEGNFLVDINSDHVDAFISLINKYKFRANIEIEITDYYVGISPSHHDTAIICAQDPRVEGFCYRSILSGSNHNENFDFDLIQMIHALPIYMEQNRSIPIEYNMKQINAIAFGKGCYIGQEFTNRTYTSGVVRKCFSTMIILNFNENYKDKINFTNGHDLSFVYENDVLKSVVDNDNVVVNVSCVKTLQYQEFAKYESFFSDEFNQLIDKLNLESDIEIAVGLIGVSYLNKFMCVNDKIIYCYSL